MGRLGGNNTGRFLVELCQSHREASFIERMELHESRPGFVEQNIIAQMADPLDDHLRVVDRPVIGALLDNCDAERPLAAPGLGILDQRIGADALAYGRLVERGAAHGADQSIGVAVGRQKDRSAATKQQGTVMRRLVIVAVKQHKIVFGHKIRQNDLVRGRSSVEHEIGLFCAENRSCLLLRLEGRPFVRQQVAKLKDRIVEIVTEDRFAQMLHEDAANRATTVEDAAVVSWTGP